jgi:hypothetical protein
MLSGKAGGARISAASGVMVAASGEATAFLDSY